VYFFLNHFTGLRDLCASKRNTEPQENGMKLAAKISTIAASTAIIAATATSALADTKSAAVTNVNPSELEVVSNGTSYTKMTNVGTTNISVHIKYDVGVAGRVHAWTVTPVIKTGYGQVKSLLGMNAYKVSKTYSFGSRPKVVDKNVVASVPASSYSSLGVEMCNKLADNLRGQGLSNKQIFDVNRSVNFTVEAAFTTEVSGAGAGDPIYEYSQPKNVLVRCKKWQGAQVPTAGDSLKAPLEIKKATMKLKEVATLGGACMVKLTTAISTSEANATIKYRFVHSSGKKSKTFSTKTAGNKIAVVNHQWEIPNKAGPETGWMQMEGVSPNFQSNKASYRMNCKSGGQTGGFKPTPGKPRVAVPLGGSGLKSN
jgi:hypothetical protein